jgi:hypothetical protein
MTAESTGRNRAAAAGTSLADRVIAAGLASRSVVRRTLEAQRQIQDLGYSFGLGELLVKGGHISLEQWVAFAADQQEPPGEESQPIATATGSPGTEEETQVVELLRASPRCLTTGEVAQELGWGQRRTASVVNLLVHAGILTAEKRGRTRVHWHPERPFMPEWGLFETVPVAQEELTEAEILERAQTHVKSTLFVFDAEEVASCEKAHLPLWRVKLQGNFPEGLVFKKTRKHTGTLYFHGARGHLCTLDPKHGFGFGAFSGEDPDAVRDLDDVVAWGSLHPADLCLNPNLMNALKDRRKVKQSLERRYGMTVLECALVFLPCWKLRLEEDEEAKRLLVLDGVLGLPVQL